MTKKRQTGLGTSAFFQNISPDEADTPPPPSPEPPTPPAKSKAAKTSKAAKIRTTVTLYPETMAQLESLKINARRQGTKATFSDILSEAIRDLAEKKGVKA